jgi:hypothetical protein
MSQVNGELTGGGKTRQTIDFLNCADEIGAVVLNVGHYETKAGEAGDDTPKVVFSTVRENTMPSLRLS